MQVQEERRMITELRIFADAEERKTMSIETE